MYEDYGEDDSAKLIRQKVQRLQVLLARRGRGSRTRRRTASNMETELRKKEETCNFNCLEPKI
jgi:hypothetical protein